MSRAPEQPKDPIRWCAALALAFLRVRTAPAEAEQLDAREVPLALLEVDALLEGDALLRRSRRGAATIQQH